MVATSGVGCGVMPSSPVLLVVPGWHVPVAAGVANPSSLLLAAFGATLVTVTGVGFHARTCRRHLGYMDVLNRLRFVALQLQITWVNPPCVEMVSRAKNNVFFLLLEDFIGFRISFYYTQRLSNLLPELCMGSRAHVQSTTTTTTNFLPD